MQNVTEPDFDEMTFEDLRASIKDAKLRKLVAFTRISQQAGVGGKLVHDLYVIYEMIEKLKVERLYYLFDIIFSMLINAKDEKALNELENSIYSLTGVCND